MGKLPELIKIFEVENDVLLACACTEEEAQKIIDEKGFGLLMDNLTVLDFNGQYVGHWKNGLLKVWEQA